MSEVQPKQLPKPIDWDELYPGRFVKAADLKGKQVTLTIAAVNLEELVGDKGKQVKGTLAFERAEKLLALNKTNGLCLKAMFGSKVQQWVGKRVTLFPTKVRGASGEEEDAIRVHGSPDIPADLPVQIELPRKRPFQMIMHRVTSASANPPIQHGNQQ